MPERGSRPEGVNNRTALIRARYIVRCIPGNTFFDWTYVAPGALSLNSSPEPSVCAHTNPSFFFAPNREIYQTIGSERPSTSPPAIFGPPSDCISRPRRFSKNGSAYLRTTANTIPAYCNSRCTLLPAASKLKPFFGHARLPRVRYGLLERDDLAKGPRAPK